MLGLLSAYGFAFIPVDVIWHEVIGPDLTAESPPVLDLSTVFASLAIGLLTALITSWISRQVGAWLGEIGHGPTASTMPYAPKPLGEEIKAV